MAKVKAKVKANSIKIGASAGVQFGRPRLLGLGVTVDTVLQAVCAEGVDEVMRGFELTRAQVWACVSYAQQAVEEKGQRTLEKPCKP